MITLSICLSDLPKEKIQTANNGKKYINLVVDKRKDTGKYVGVKYDYSVCNDQIYTDLLYMLNDIKEQIKIREKFLSKVPSEGATIVYEQTGEVRTIYPPIKQGSQGITITFKK